MVDSSKNLLQIYNHENQYIMPFLAHTDDYSCGRNERMISPIM